MNSYNEIMQIRGKLISDYVDQIIEGNHLTNFEKSFVISAIRRKCFEYMNENNGKKFVTIMMNKVN